MKSWWKESVIYQIYPRSFKDSNGDGIGDIRGIIEKLDYLQNLGVDILWLSPIYASPNDDNGYDVSDYCAIMEEAGTMDDFDELLKGVHQRSMKLLMDLVVNHSSDEHKWFQQSRLSKDNPYRDFYIWRPENPGNWRSFFSGSAWEYDAQTKENYLHLFSKKQPDLNWENPKLRQAIYKIMRFWLDKGIDGFRMDVISVISKDLAFPEIDFSNGFAAAIDEYANGPRVHEYLREMNEEVLSKYDITTIGETIGVTPKNVLNYVGKQRKELHMLYHFDLLGLPIGDGGRLDPVNWKLTDFKKIIADWDKAIGQEGWLTLSLDNHDFGRMLSTFGEDGTYRVQSAKLLAIFLLTMRATPCLYQGSEIGMTNIVFNSIDEYRDIETLNAYQECSVKGMDEADFIKAMAKNNRDNARTPMQWDDSLFSGFSKVTPWLKVNPNYTEINTKKALVEQDSIFYFYKNMLEYRKANLSLVYSDLEIIDIENEQLFMYKRHDKDNTYCVVLNFSSREIPLQLPDEFLASKIAICNYSRTNPNILQPWEARIYRKE